MAQDIPPHFRVVFNPRELSVRPRHCPFLLAIPASFRETDRYPMPIFGLKISDALIVGFVISSKDYRLSLQATRAERLWMLHAELSTPHGYVAQLTKR